MNLRYIFPVIIFFLCALFSCAKTETQNLGPAPLTDSFLIKMQDSTFTPKIFTVKKGSTVKWLSYDDVNYYRVTADNGEFTSNLILPAHFFTYTTTKADTIPYHGNYNGMTGILIVTD